MAKKPRFSMKVRTIGRQELDLLECLLRIDRHQSLNPLADEMLQRLVEAGLVDASDGELSLTAAGIERCRSLQHRISADKEAAKVLAARGLELAKDTSREVS